MLLAGSQSGFSVNVVYSRIQRARKCNFLEIKWKNYRKGGWAEKHEGTQRLHRRTRRGDSKNKEAEVCRSPSKGKGTHFSTGRKLAVIYYCWQMELQPQLAIYQALKKSSKLSWRWVGNQLQCWRKKNHMLWRLSGSSPCSQKKIKGGSGWWLTSLSNRNIHLLVWPNAYGEILPKSELLHKFAKAHSAIWHLLHVAHSLGS